MNLEIKTSSIDDNDDNDDDYNSLDVVRVININKLGIIVNKSKSFKNEWNVEIPIILPQSKVFLSIYDIFI